MDLITQMQNYVGYLSVFMANSLEHIYTQAPPIAPPPLATLPPPLPSSTITTASASPPVDPSSSSPAVSAPPTLDAAFSAAMDERALQLMKRVAELQALIGCLPAHVSSEEEQLAQLAELQRANEAEERRVLEAREEAELWQQRLAHVLQQAAAAQLAISTEQRSARAPPPLRTKTRPDRLHVVVRRRTGTGTAQSTRQSSADAVGDTQ